MLPFGLWQFASMQADAECFWSRHWNNTGGACNTNQWETTMARYPGDAGKKTAHSGFSHSTATVTHGMTASCNSSVHILICFQNVFVNTGWIVLCAKLDTQYSLFSLLCILLLLACKIGAAWKETWRSYVQWSVVCAVKRQFPLATHKWTSILIVKLHGVCFLTFGLGCRWIMIRSWRTWR